MEVHRIFIILSEGIMQQNQDDMKNYFEYQIAKNNIEVVNMLNTKYIIVPDKQGQARLQKNGSANGNAWFVNQVEIVRSADEEIKALDSLKTKEKAIVNIEFKSLLPKADFRKDSLAIIQLTNYQPNELRYKSKTQSEQFAVFSDMYYKNGWNAYIDGKKVPIIRANYVLRALIIPKGKHEIVFKFEPAVIKKGTVISLISYALLVLIPIGWFFIEKKKTKNEPPQ